MREVVNQQQQDRHEERVTIEGTQNRRNNLLKKLRVQEVTDWFQKWELPMQYPEKDEQEQVRRAYLHRTWQPRT